MRIELARLTDALAHKGGDCAAGLVVPGAVVGVVPDNGAPIERGPAADDKGKGVDLAAKSDEKGPDGKGPDAKGPDANKGPNDAKGPDPQDKGPNEKGPNDKGPNNKSMAEKDQKKDAPKPMVVPPDAKQKQELGFLKGDWRSRTGIAASTGEKDIRPEYTLDDKGKGK